MRLLQIVGSKSEVAAQAEVQVHVGIVVGGLATVGGFGSAIKGTSVHTRSGERLG